MRIRSILTAALALALAPRVLHAAGVGTTGAQFLKVGVGARPLAMGGAFSALADDVNAIYWNPGALTEVKRRNLALSYNSMFQDENQGFLAYAAPLKDDMGAFGVGINYLVVSNIEKRAGDTETPDSTFSNQNFALNASYARPEVLERLSVGGSLKYIRETMDTFSANAVALDLGALYRTAIPNLAAGLSLQNLGTKIGPDPLPLLFKGGAAYKLFDSRLALASDLDWLAQDKRFYVDFGLEYWAQKALAFRAGYQLGRGGDQLGGMVGLGAGVGLRLERLDIDYAFVPFGNLGDTHRMTLGFRF